jgi:hypothetical protein
MRLNIFRRLVLRILFLQIIIFVTRTYAQDKKVVIIKSDPPGAMLYFKGENSFIGVTPFKVKPSLLGSYKITAVKQGYEKINVEYYFKGTESGTLRLGLIPKTRFKAGIRSLVFPGWGQMYSERKKFGLFVSLLQAGTGIFALIAHQDYNKAYDQYQNAWDDYKANEKYSDLRSEKRDILEAKYNKAEDAFNKRQTWLYISTGLWLYNFLDSIFFFPSFDNEIFNRSLPGISANLKNDTVGLMLTYPF